MCILSPENIENVIQTIIGWPTNTSAVGKEGSMFKILVDTCVWLDLGKDPHQLGRSGRTSFVKPDAYIVNIRMVINSHEVKSGFASLYPTYQLAARGASLALFLMRFYYPYACRN
jgi:hypothetical protein